MYLFSAYYYLSVIIKFLYLLFIQRQCLSLSSKSIEHHTVFLNSTFVNKEEHEWETQRAVAPLLRNLQDTSISSCLLPPRCHLPSAGFPRFHRDGLPFKDFILVLVSMNRKTEEM